MVDDSALSGSLDGESFENDLGTLIDLQNIAWTEGNLVAAVDGDRPGSGGEFDPLGQGDDAAVEAGRELDGWGEARGSHGICHGDGVGQRYAHMAGGSGRSV